MGDEQSTRERPWTCGENGCTGTMREYVPPATKAVPQGSHFKCDTCGRTLDLAEPQRRG